jgi:hypothetical protein
MVCTGPLADAELDGQGLAALEFLDLELPEPLGLALAASATSFKDCQGESGLTEKIAGSSVTMPNSSGLPAQASTPDSRSLLISSAE